MKDTKAAKAEKIKAEKRVKEEEKEDHTVQHTNPVRQTQTKEGPLIAPATPNIERAQSDLRETVIQMMYVSGETGEPSVETLAIIEEIVRQQVIELVS